MSRFNKCVLKITCKFNIVNPHIQLFFNSFNGPNTIITKIDYL